MSLTSLAARFALTLCAIFAHSAFAEAANVTLKVVLPTSNPGSVTAAGGINCTPACSASYAAGTTVTLYQWVDGSSIFGSWSVGSCGSARSCAVTLNADTTVTATFNGPNGSVGGGIIRGGSSSSASSTGASTSASASSISTPPPLAPPMALGSGEAMVSWLAPSENTDGTVLTDLTGFNIYYSQDPLNFDQVVTLDCYWCLWTRINNLGPGTWYFAVKSYNRAGVESSYSRILSKRVG
jgi:hypothetical protein